MGKKIYLQNFLTKQFNTTMNIQMISWTNRSLFNSMKQL